MGFSGCQAAEHEFRRTKHVAWMASEPSGTWKSCGLKQKSLMHRSSLSAGSAAPGTLAAQNNNPYTTNTSPSVVYVPGSAGNSRAAAPAAFYPPAPAPGPVVALGPLGAQAQVAAGNTSFGETQLTGVGPIYKKQDSLEPVSSVLSSLDVSQIACIPSNLH